MQICKEHWAYLKQALKDRGLESLINKDAEAVADYIKSELTGTKKLEDYDPLMDCNWMIMNRALEAGGIYLLSRKADGSAYCPVCEAIAHEKGDGKYWLDGPADATLKYCQDNNLVHKVQ